MWGGGLSSEIIKAGSTLSEYLQLMTKLSLLSMDSVASLSYHALVLPATLRHRSHDCPAVTSRHKRYTLM